MTLILIVCSIGICCQFNFEYRNEYLSVSYKGITSFDTSNFRSGVSTTKYLKLTDSSLSEQIDFASWLKLEYIILINTECICPQCHFIIVGFCTAASTIILPDSTSCATTVISTSSESDPTTILTKVLPTTGQPSP